MKIMTFKEFNNLSKENAFSALEKCCVSKTWISKMIENKPFSSENDLIKTAASIWYNDCSLDDFKEAFTGHPKIGNVESLKEKFANTKNWANNEQAKVADANTKTIEALAKANTLYEDKFGYIFIVSASGKSADDMLAIINTRLLHNPEDEIAVAMNEQHKITVIRLVKLIEGLSNNSDMSSHLTTHALDTSTGIPANNMIITLKQFKNNEWKPMSIGITNNDGRIADVLPAGQLLKPDTYTMTFNTKNYYESHNQKGFYPEVSIQFTVTDVSHYHIPLLINPFGYTTYRGS
jgi:5-hydroxyisourate hydrolase/2-oxo-4-hydroxy-4-carboxy-5-ureidoimidazoline decarboxylase